MAERLHPQEALADLVTDMQKLAQVSRVIGRNTLNCRSSDGQYLYELTAADLEQHDLASVGIAEISNIHQWRLTRSSGSFSEGNFEMTRYGIHQHEDGEFYMITSEHRASQRPSAHEHRVGAIRRGRRLQRGLVLSAPSTRDYADLDNAIFDITRDTESTILMYQRDKIELERKLPAGLVDLLPHCVLKIAHPN